MYKYQKNFYKVSYHFLCTFNLCITDAEGRVVVNIGHSEKENNIYVAPQIARIIKPHQIGGVRFLFDNIVESIQLFSNSSGFGCILAHSMGNILITTNA